MNNLPVSSSSFKSQYSPLFTISQVKLLFRLHIRQW
uniref:Uncharacterized protein n=1 Tax=Anguilla anguilla TaxID=7936 RepID=A0A0E9RRU0_ANGAN